MTNEDKNLIEVKTALENGIPLDKFGAYLKIFLDPHLWVFYTKHNPESSAWRHWQKVFGGLICTEKSTTTGKNAPNVYKPEKT